MLSNATPVKAGFHFSDQIPAISYFTVLTVQLKVRSKIFHQNPFEFFTMCFEHQCTFDYSAFNPCGKIGSIGSRNFVLSKKSDAQSLGDSVGTTTRKISGRWKAWLNKSLGLMDPSH